MSNTVFCGSKRNVACRGAKNRSPRRGQALLLAVLLMIFAALLGSTFITIVALNMNQTARQEEKAAARSATLAGIKVVNEQLTNSAKGEAWRPEQITPPPAPGDLDYNLYFTPLDKAQGWSRTTPAPSSNDTMPTNWGYAAGDWNRDGKSPASSPYSPDDANKDDWAKLEYAKKYGLPGGLPQRVFVKFPDPRQPIATNTPTYAAEVSFLTTQNAGTGEVDKKGMLRITVIGLSPNNPNVFERRVAYKPTSNNGGAFCFARYDSNFNPTKNKVVATKLTAAPANNLITGTSTLSVVDTSGFAAGQTVTLTGASDDVQVIRSVDSATSMTLGGAVTTPSNFGFGSDVKLASTLFDGLTVIDADGWATSGGNYYGNPPLDPQRIAASLGSGKPLGVHINSDMAIQGQAIVGLRPADTATNFSGDSLDVSGRIVDGKATESGFDVKGSLYSYSDTTVPSATPTPVPVKIPNSVQLANSRLSPPTYTLTGMQKQVRDGALAGNPTAADNAAKVIAPPDFQQVAQRYRDLTQFADPGSGSTFGFGPGLYINNQDEVEKIKTTTGYATLSSSALQRLWQRKSFQVTGAANNNIAYTGTVGGIASGATAMRLSFPRPDLDSYKYPKDLLTSANSSLEERGVRGWISPWEFLPRGTQVELKGTTIVVTRDERSDKVDNSPDFGKWKSWTQPDGTTLGNNLSVNNVGKTFRMEINLLTGQRSFGAAGNTYSYGGAIPFNGVIFAEGNLRVRGYLDDTLLPATMRNLTIVSMNNIYIEGRLWQKTNSTSGTKGRFALIAKKNVVLNPTGFIARTPGVVDIDVANATTDVATSGSGSTLICPTAARYKVGDRLMVGTDTTIYTVTGFTSTGIVLDRGLTAAVTAGARVRLVADPVVASGRPSTTAPTAMTAKESEDWFRKLNATTDVLLRDVKFDGYQFSANTPLYLAGQHRAQMKQAFTLKKATGLPIGVTASTTLDVKKESTSDSSISGVLASNEKTFVTSGGTGNLSQDLLLISPATSRGDDATNTIGNLRQQITSSGANWTIDTTTYDASLDSLAARHLAQQTGATFDASGNLTTYLATSVGFFYGSTLSNLVSGNPAFFIGTSPTAAPTATSDEDPKYVNTLFYQRKTSPTATTYEQARLRWDSSFGSNGSTGYAPINESVSTLAANTAIPDITMAFRPDATGLADYRVGELKVETDSFVASANRTYNALPYTIEATIYAAEGSWFVIAPPLNKPFDMNDDNVPVASTNYSGTMDNGTTLRATNEEKNAAMRYRRLNYQIIVRGSIAQGFSPTSIVDLDNESDPDNDNFGATRKWIDALSYPATLAAPDAANNYDVPARAYVGKVASWQTIAYLSDPLPDDSGLLLPASPDLLYTN